MLYSEAVLKMAEVRSPAPPPSDTDIRKDIARTQLLLRLAGPVCDLLTEIQRQADVTDVFVTPGMTEIEVFGAASERALWEPMLAWLRKLATLHDRPTFLTSEFILRKGIAASVVTLWRDDQPRGNALSFGLQVRERSGVVEGRFFPKSDAFRPLQGKADIAWLASQVPAGLFDTSRKDEPSVRCPPASSVSRVLSMIEARTFR